LFFIALCPSDEQCCDEACLLAGRDILPIQREIVSINETTCVILVFYLYLDVRRFEQFLGEKTPLSGPLLNAKATQFIIDTTNKR
jgi:hypothetical protein